MILFGHLAECVGCGMRLHIVKITRRLGYLCILSYKIKFIHVA